MHSEEDPRDFKFFLLFIKLKVIYVNRDKKQKGNERTSDLQAENRVFTYK